MRRLFSHGGREILELIGVKSLFLGFNHQVGWRSLRTLIKLLNVQAHTVILVAESRATSRKASETTIDQLLEFQ